MLECNSGICITKWIDESFDTGIAFNLKVSKGFLETFFRRQSHQRNRQQKNQNDFHV